MTMAQPQHKRTKRCMAMNSARHARKNCNEMRLSSRKVYLVDVGHLIVDFLPNVDLMVPNSLQTVLEDLIGKVLDGLRLTRHGGSGIEFS